MTISIRPIAMFRSGDWILIFNDNPRGWDFFSAASLLPREVLAQFVDETSAEDLSDSRLTDGLIILPISATSLPTCFPEHRVVGVHPSLSGEGIPVWDGPTTRAQESFTEDPEAIGDEAEAFLLSLSS